MADGLISIKEKVKKKVEDTLALKRKEPVRGSYRYFVRGQSDKPQEVWDLFNLSHFSQSVLCWGFVPCPKAFSRLHLLKVILVS